VQRQHRLFAGQDGVGVFQQAFPVQLHGAHFRAHAGRRRWQAGSGVAFLQIAPAPGKIVARIAQQLERSGLAGGRFGGILGNALGQHAQLTGVANVLFVVSGLGIEVREIGEQQHDEDNQCDEQHDDLRPTPRPFHWLACFCFYHRSSPVNPHPSLLAEEPVGASLLAIQAPRCFRNTALSSNREQARSHRGPRL